MAKNQSSWIADILRIAVHGYQESSYSLSKVAGVDQSNLKRFRDGTHGLSLNSAERLSKALGLGLAVVNYLPDLSALETALEEAASSARRQIDAIGFNLQSNCYMREIENVVTKGSASFRHLYLDDQKLSHEKHILLENLIGRPNVTVRRTEGAYFDLLLADGQCVVQLPTPHSRILCGLHFRGYDQIAQFSEYFQRVFESHDQVHDKSYLTQLCKTCSTETTHKAADPRGVRKRIKFEEFPERMLRPVNLWPGGVPAERLTKYRKLVEQTVVLIREGEDLWQNLPAIIQTIFQQRGWKWNGFYVRRPNQLELSYLAGPPTCNTLDLLDNGAVGSSGVCWDCIHLNDVIPVDDVTQYVGYVDCDKISHIKTVSEIVCPIRNAEDEPIAVWDLDSEQKIAPEDVAFLERFFAMLSALLKPNERNFKLVS